MAGARPVAICFDFWNTLVVEPGGMLSALRREAVLQTLIEHEVELDQGVLEAHLAAAKALQEAAWKRGRRFAPSRGARHVAAAIEGIDERVRERVVEAFLDAGRTADLQLTPHVPATLEALATAEVQLGIVCDVGLTGSQHLRAFLDRAGVLRHFRGWAFSDEVGHFKPSPEIFARMTSQFTLSDGDPVWHVGDLRRTDVAGARQSGLVPIRYRGIADDDSDAPEADHVIDDLTELIELAAR